MDGPVPICGTSGRWFTFQDDKSHVNHSHVWMCVSRVCHLTNIIHASLPFFSLFCSSLSRHFIVIYFNYLLSLRVQVFVCTPSVQFSERLCGIDNGTQQHFLISYNFIAIFYYFLPHFNFHIVFFSFLNFFYYYRLNVSFNSSNRLLTDL